MKTIQAEYESLSTYLINYKIATMEQLKNILGTTSRMTVFRKLERLGCISSCSHSGKYYALTNTARFNKYGIWCYNSVLFSKYGTLKNTLKTMIDNSAEGFTAAELKKILQVKLEDSLYILIKEKAVIRTKISGVYVYFSDKSNFKKMQELKRTDSIHPCRIGTESDGFSDELKAALIIFLSTLNEKQRRLYAGYESLKIGSGGDELIANMLGLNRKTVAKGRQELLGGNVDVDTVRDSGGGRKTIKKKFSM